MNTAQEMAAIVYKALDDKKAFDIADGTNKNQVQAMCDSVEEEMHKAGYSLKSVEGYSQGGWILLDYYDIIVHIFSDEARRFYDIERIWNDAADVTKDLLS